MAMIFCRGCGSEIHESAIACPSCGAPQQNSKAEHKSDKTILPAFLLCFFLGVFGIHRFYVGKVGTGILQLITFGGFFIWAFFDFIMIIAGEFSDREGKRLTEWV